MEGAGQASVDERIRAIVARQHGVISRAQLLGMGLTPGAIDGRVRTRRLRALHRGVYLHGALAGLCGHASAAWLWDILPEGSRGDLVHVTHIGSERRRPGIRAHRVTSLPETHVADVEGIPATAPARTLLDLAAGVGGRALEQAVARSERLGLAEVAELRTLVRSVGPRPGIPALRSVLNRGEPALARSAAEERFLALAREGGLPPPATNARVGRYEVDFHWPLQRVAVEVDGFAHHSSRREFENDRRRDAELAAGGIQVLRVTWRQLTDEPVAVLVRVARTLALADVRERPPR